MKDMNLSSKINNCFGNFYKKLDTFAGRVGKKFENPSASKLSDHPLLFSS